MRLVKWTPAMDAKLEAMYPRFPQDQIEREFNLHWLQIQRRANKLKIKRKTPWVRKIKGPSGPAAQFITELRGARLMAKIRACDLERRMGYSADVVTRWESGRSSIGIAPLIDWANALGFELKLVPKVEKPLKAIAPKSSRKGPGVPVFCRANSLIELGL